MRHNIFAMLTLALTLSATSCRSGSLESEGQISDGESITFTARMQQDAQSRSSVNGGTVRWTAGDIIAVSDGTSTENVTLSESDISADGLTATFSVTGLSADASKYHAAYPAGQVVAFDGVTGLVCLDGTYEISTGTFSAGVAETSGTSFSFRNVFHLIHLSTDISDADHVVFESNSDQRQYSRFEVRTADGTLSGEPVWDDSQLHIESPVDGRGEAFIPILPGISFPEGFRIEVCDSNSVTLAKFDSSSPFTSARNKVTTVSDFDSRAVQRSTVFDESSVVTSLAVISDTHVDAATGTVANKFKNALTMLSSQALLHDDDGIDGVLVVGDLINDGYNGNYGQTSYWKSLYESVFDPSSIPMVYCLGNHDVPWNVSMVSGAANFRTTFGDAYYTSDNDISSGTSLECRHCTVGGYEVLCISPIGATPVIYDAEAVSWLDEKLAGITAADPDRYVIVLTHPMIHGTVYGSTDDSAPSNPTYWYTDGLSNVLKKYPQAVTFGGHLHYPLNDPRSVWQGEFTAFGCASTKYMAFEGGSNYVYKYSSTTLYDRNEYSEGLLVQFDSNGNMRATRMDFFNGAVIGEPWEIRYPDVGGKSHLERYSSTVRQSSNSSPVMTALEVVQVPSSSEKILCSARWKAAQDDEFAHHYEVKLKSGSSETEQWVMSDFYRNPDPSTMKSEYSFSLGFLSAGTYEVSVTAVDSWGARSNTLTRQFEVDGLPASDTALPEPYADFSFSGGKIVDEKGAVRVFNHGAEPVRTTVLWNGTYHEADALGTGAGKFVICQADDFNSPSSFSKFAENGFSFEVLYVDNAGSSAVQGILCGTETGGWGLALSAKGVPYAIVGDGTSTSSYSYRSAYSASAPSRSAVTHIAGVYDHSGGSLKLYVNGSLAATTSLTSSFLPGAGDAFNRFCLGADIKQDNLSSVDFPSAMMSILEARLYSVALSSSQVSEACSKALQIFD